MKMDMMHWLLIAVVVVIGYMYYDKAMKK